MTIIKEMWEKLNGARGGSLQTARDCSALTLPHLLPPEGHSEASPLLTPYQSLGARGVNNLSSKMLLTLFPTNTAFFRFTINPDLLDQTEGEDVKDAIEDALRKRENKLSRRLETGNLRPTLGSIMKHLIVTGNALLYTPIKGEARMYAINQYVVVRDAMGNVTKIVIKESVHPNTLSDQIRSTCEIVAEGKDADELIDVYTCLQLRPEGKTEWYQEINEIEVPDSRGTAPKGVTPPYLPLRWQAVSGNDYGIGLVEEYLGDLRSLEGLTASVVDFAAAAAKILLLIHPNSATKAEDIAKAVSGDAIVGDIKDFDVLQLDKFADFKVAKAVIDDLTLRLSHVFLLQSGTVRDAERVTAAEIAAMAQELEDVLGGVYTVMSQELQLPLVKRLIAAENFPKMPKVNGEEAVDPVIVTGFEALGRGHELNKIRAYVSDYIGLLGEAAIERLDPVKVGNKLGHGHNIDPAEIFKTEEQLAQETAANQQASLTQTLTEKGAGPAISAAVQTNK